GVWGGGGLSPPPALRGGVAEGKARSRVRVFWLIHTLTLPSLCDGPPLSRGAGEGLNYARAGNSAISRPSADSAVATMWRALSPAASYCAFGESCSRNTSGRTIGRILRPLSS